MILTRIKARNVLKYEQLDLHLPKSGLIAISGQNESGKSSIGETVCFALFGRTFSIEPNEVEKVVRWGENHCTVTLDFSVGDQEYELSRFLDREGNHSAKLLRLGEEEAIARGVNHVDTALLELLGFEYEQFVESFYLAQREITTPHPHSQAVKIMAGMAPLEAVVKEIKSEVAERSELLDEVQAECDDIERALDDLGVQPGHLQGLEQDRFETVEQHDQIHVLINEVSERLQAYEDNTHAIYKAISQGSRAAFFRFVFFMLALLSGGIWGLLTQGDKYPETASLADMLRSQLNDFLPQWHEIELVWLGYAAAGFFALFLWMWMRVGSKAARVHKMRIESGQLADSLIRAREIDIEIEAAEEAEASDAAESASQGDSEEMQTEAVAEVVPVRPDVVELDVIKVGIANGEATIRKTREYTERELAWLAYVEELLAAETLRLNDGIVDENERIAEAVGLHEILSGMQEKRNEVLGRIELRHKSLELLGGAIDHLSNNFNRDIKDLVGRMLPLFTDARYEHLKIDKDLNVRVFSSEKRDFMDLEEVSSGTQRQIMLALRLALSQKLLSRAVTGKQFAFLDEPFAFFDEERTQNALAALAELGEDVSQVWIVAQTFPEKSEVQFGTSIVCQRGQASLSAGTE